MIYFLVATAALMFGLYNVFIKVSSDHIHAVLGAVVLQIVAALVGLALLGWLHATSSAELTVTGRGLMLSAMAGVAIGLVAILSFVVYGRGMAVAVGNPLSVGGPRICTTRAGPVRLGYHSHLLQLRAGAR